MLEAAVTMVTLSPLGRGRSGAGYQANEGPGGSALPGAHPLLVICSELLPHPELLPLTPRCSTCKPLFASLSNELQLVWYAPLSSYYAELFSHLDLPYLDLLPHFELLFLIGMIWSTITLLLRIVFLPCTALLPHSDLLFHHVYVALHLHIHV